jgi:hypothetical protein
MGLSILQTRFLAARMHTKTDGEAAELASINQGTVSGWKAEDPEFAEAYEQMRLEPVKLARAMAAEQLGHVINRLVEASDAEKPVMVVIGQKRGEGTAPVMGEDGKPEQTVIGVPDWKTRLAATEQLGKIHGLFINRTESTGANGKPLEHVVTTKPAIDYSKLSNEQLDQLRSILEAAGVQDA